MRFGVMCHASGITAFAQSCIQQISDLAPPALLIVDCAAPRRSTLREKLRKSIRLDGNLWHLHNRFSPMQDIPAYRRSPLEDCLPGIARLECAVTRKGKWSEYFSDADLERIR